MSDHDDGFQAGYRAAKRHYGDEPRAHLAAIRRLTRQFRADHMAGRVPPFLTAFVDELDKQTEDAR